MLLLLLRLRLLRFSEQTLRGALLLGWVVWSREDFGDAAEPVLIVVVIVVVVNVHVMMMMMEGCYSVDVGGVVDIDEFGFAVKAENLYSSRERLVSCFLVPSPVELFLVSACRIAAAYYGDSTGLRDVHVGEAVRFDGFVVEPGAIARFPLEAADHAEFGAAATGHVVAAFFQLDGRGAVEAALPAFFLCNLDEFLCSGVFRAFAAGVPLVVARAADFHLASLTFAVLPASVGATAGIDVDMCGFDP